MARSVSVPVETSYIQARSLSVPSAWSVSSAQSVSQSASSARPVLSITTASDRRHTSTAGTRLRCTSTSRIGYYCCYTEIFRSCLPRPRSSCPYNARIQRTPTSILTYRPQTGFDRHLRRSKRAGIRSQGYFNSIILLSSPGYGATFNPDRRDQSTRPTLPQPRTNDSQVLDHKGKENLETGKGQQQELSTRPTRRILRGRRSLARPTYVDDPNSEGDISFNTGAHRDEGSPPPSSLTRRLKLLSTACPFDHNGLKFV